MYDQSMYEHITERIVTRIQDALENGTKFYWTKPWSQGVKRPFRYVERKYYRGINMVILDPGEYLTHKQFLDLKKKNPDLKIRKGCHTSPVYFFKMLDKKTKEEPAEEVQENKRKQQIPMLRYFRVYNASDIENLELRFPLEKHEHNESELSDIADNVFAEYCASNEIDVIFSENGTRAYYRDFTKSIEVPVKENFSSMYEYYCACFHEAIHSTGPKLGRNINNEFGSKNYSFEELVAEIGAQMCCSILSITDDSTDSEECFTNSIAYLKGWMEKLKDDTHLLVKASTYAQKAVDCICGNLIKEELCEENEGAEEVAI